MLIPNVIRPADQWRDPRHRRGLASELAAARHLEALGWAIMAHRFRWGHHDIDLIARRGNLVAFIEVKGRQAGGRFGTGRESIGWKKRRVLQLAAQLWVIRHGCRADLYRYDVIEVEWPEAGFPQIIHIQDAWRGVEK